MRARRVAAEEIEPLHAIVAACGLDLERRFGFSHWVPPWPLDRMREEARERSVFAIEEAGVAIGTFTVGPPPRIAARLLPRARLRRPRRRDQPRARGDLLRARYLIARTASPSTR